MEKPSPEDFWEILKNIRFEPIFHPPEPEILVKTLPWGVALCTQSLSSRALTADPFRPDFIFHLFLFFFFFRVSIGASVAILFSGTVGRKNYGFFEILFAQKSLMNYYFFQTLMPRTYANGLIDARILIWVRSRPDLFDFYTFPRIFQTAS